MCLSMVRFRTANHKLPIETGRWSGIYHSDRKCNLCNNNDLGDEFHYLLVCPYFLQSRKKYLKKYYYLRPNVIKYKEFLSTKSEIKLKKLSLFIAEILQFFNNY